MEFKDIKKTIEIDLWIYAFRNIVLENKDRFCFEPNTCFRAMLAYTNSHRLKGPRSIEEVEDELHYMRRKVGFLKLGETYPKTIENSRRSVRVFSTTKSQKDKPIYRTENFSSGDEVYFKLFDNENLKEVIGAKDNGKVKDNKDEIKKENNAENNPKETTGGKEDGKNGK